MWRQVVGRSRSSAMYLRCCRCLQGLCLLAVVLSAILLIDFNIGRPSLRILEKIWPPLWEIGDVLRKSIPCDPAYQHKATLPSKRNVTIVSAYFNLGSFVKGTSGGNFSTRLYAHWATVFGRIQNPVVFYTDSWEFKDLIENERQNLRKVTRVVFIAKRDSLWAFQLRSSIKQIFDNPEYPKYEPETTIVDYPCVQHAKYELVTDTITKGYFPSEFYAWLDVGYFRDIVDDNDNNLEMEIPCNFNASRVAFNCVERQSMKRIPGDIILNHYIWVGGGLFFGRADVLQAFYKQYQRAVSTFIEAGLVGSDQQILYAMFSDKGREKISPHVEIQVYYPEGHLNWWFYLGYLCLKFLPIDRQEYHEN